MAQPSSISLCGTERVSALACLLIPTTERLATCHALLGRAGAVVGMGARHSYQQQLATCRTLQWQAEQLLPPSVAMKRGGNK